MSKLRATPLMTLIFGVAVGASVVWLLPQQPLTAGTANSADKFSMVTVPVEGIADTEAVFVLDHFTGIVRGGRLSNRTGKFTHQYLHSVADDFKVSSGQRNPEYTIVSGNAQLSGQGGQPARGIIYIGEKSSGAVIAYGFALPQGRGGQVEQLIKLDGFLFREKI